MVGFRLRLEDTYWSKGFFNVPVDFQRFLSQQDGPLDIYLAAETQPIGGRITRKANSNATPRIFGNKPLRVFFHASFSRGGFARVEIVSETAIRIGAEIADQHFTEPSGKRMSESLTESSPPMSWPDFQNLATQRMQQHFGVSLAERAVPGVPKRFDMVSTDGTVVGDAKNLTLVRGIDLPPAKFMEIAGHVWLLEKTGASRVFLVFGNQRQVPERWLAKYAGIAGRVEFYFLAADGALDRLH
jgi:hypothetical protein